MEPEAPPQEPKGRRNRRGSEKRKRSLPPFPVRYLPEERAEVRAAAEAAGMTMGSYIRWRTLRQPKTRARRAATVDVIALAKTLAQVNRMGGNLHQLVRHVNFGGTLEAGEIRAALVGYEEMVAAIMSALGIRP